MIVLIAIFVGIFALVIIGIAVALLVWSTKPKPPASQYFPPIYVAPIGESNSPSPIPSPSIYQQQGKTRGRRIVNERKVGGVPVDDRGRFFVACYGPDDGYGGKGAYSNDLVPMKSIALPRGRTDGADVSTRTSSTLLTTDFNHPLVAETLRKTGTWTHEAEYAFMKDEVNRPRYLMVDENGKESCVRVDDKCEGCYWGDRGIGGTKGFDFDVYTPHSDATCWQHRPNQWVEVYESPDC